VILAVLILQAVTLAVFLAQSVWGALALSAARRASAAADADRAAERSSFGSGWAKAEASARTAAPSAQPRRHLPELCLTCGKDLGRTIAISRDTIAARGPSRSKNAQAALHRAALGFCSVACEEGTPAVHGAPAEDSVARRILDGEGVQTPAAEEGKRS
jgi:hypothetical protein